MTSNDPKGSHKTLLISEIMLLDLPPGTSLTFPPGNLENLDKIKLKSILNDLKKLGTEWN